jgi:aryl-alcohol dehydrogenase-like predicted oxidoreductase
MFAWQFSKALYTADKHGWTRFASMTNHLSLLNREEEREMLPLCQDQGIAVMPWSPLARGRLTRDWDVTTYRTETDEAGKKMHAASVTSDKAIADAVAVIAAKRAIPRAQVALAWVLQQAAVTSPIVGVSKPQHLSDAVGSLSVRLDAAEIELLEANYVPHSVVGFS